MQNTFEILMGFLARYGAEVEGRELSSLSVETKTRLQRFARGQLYESEQLDVIGQLHERPEWIAFLAEEVKVLRVPRGKKP
jgi:hypothetical protein